MTTFLSLCVGCGGLDLGAIRAGLIPTAAYEIDKAACAAYERVTGHPVQQADVTRLDPSSLPDADWLIAGPPCQDFSVSGRRRKEDGERNLFPQMLEVVRVKRPARFVFENVPGLVATTYLHSLIQTLTGYGYRVEYRVLNAANFGVAQTRERVFLVGRRDGQAWQWPTPTHSQHPDLWGSRQWVGAIDVLADWFPRAAVKPLPKWLISRLPDPVPDNVIYARQLSHTQHRTPTWRPLHHPAFTITSSDGGNDQPAMWNGQPYRLDASAAARLQGLPDVKIPIRIVGNAVPPLLAETLIRAAQGA